MSGSVYSKVLASKRERNPDFSIEIWVAPFSDVKSNHVHSVLAIYSKDRGHDRDVAHIILNPYTNKCWRRFAIVKELMHIYTDVISNSSRPSRTLHELLSYARNARFSTGEIFTSKSIIAPPFHREMDLDSELACFLTAMELAIPRVLRADISDWVRNRESHYDVARKLLMPQAIIVDYFDWYGEYSHAARKHYGLPTLC